MRIPINDNREFLSLCHSVITMQNLDKSFICNCYLYCIIQVYQTLNQAYNITATGACNVIICSDNIMSGCNAKRKTRPTDDYDIESTSQGECTI